MAAPNPAIAMPMATPGVNPPPAPANPPNHEDYRNAARHLENVQNSLRAKVPGAGAQHLVDATRYSYDIFNGIPGPVTGGPAGAPAWAILLHNKLNRMDHSMNMNFNRGLGAGGVGPLMYNIVPFPNGEDPTQPPHNLPRIRSEDDIGDAAHLTTQQLGAYLRGYGVEVPRGREARETAVAMAIGVRTP